MALGKRKQEQQELRVATTSLPQSPGHPFYQKLNRLLGEAKFDEYVEGLCRPYQPVEEQHILWNRLWQPAATT